MNININDFSEIITQLIGLGEDKDELYYWLGIYDDLSEGQQGALYANLNRELESLQNITGKED